LVSVLERWIDNSMIEARATKLKEKRQTDRFTPAGRYEGVLDTIVQLFRVYASGVITPDQDPMDTKESLSNSICKQQTQMAEREFSGFISAVKELLGPEQAQLSAVDWLDELELMDSQRGPTSRDWRAVTIAASARLANRFKTGPHDRSFAEDVDQYEGIDDTFV
jgi:hypothetical protein